MCTVLPIAGYHKGLFYFIVSSHKTMSTVVILVRNTIIKNNKSFLQCMSGQKTQSSWRGEHDCTVTLLQLSNMGIVHGATNGIQTGLMDWHKCTWSCVTEQMHLIGKWFVSIGVPLHSTWPSEATQWYSANLWLHVSTQHHPFDKPLLHSTFELNGAVWFSFGIQCTSISKL